MFPGQNDQPRLRLIAHRIQVFLRPGKIIDQADRRGVVIGEIKASIFLETRDLSQVEGAICVDVGIEAPGRIHRNQLAVRVEHPAVIGTSERLGAAALFTADSRATMRARIEECPDLAAATAHEDEVAPAHGARHKITLRGKLGRVADIQPAFREDQLLFLLEDRRAAVGVSIDAKSMVSEVDIDKLVLRIYEGGHDYLLIAPAIRYDAVLYAFLPIRTIVEQVRRQCGLPV